MAQNPNPINFGFHFGISAARLNQAFKEASVSLKSLAEAMEVCKAWREDNMQSSGTILAKNPTVARMFGVVFVTNYASIPLQDATARIWNKVHGVRRKPEIVYTSIGAFTAIDWATPGSDQSITLHWEPGVTVKLRGSRGLR